MTKRAAGAPSAGQRRSEPYQKPPPAPCGQFCSGRRAVGLPRKEGTVSLLMGKDVIAAWVHVTWPSHFHLNTLAPRDPADSSDVAGPGAAGARYQEPRSCSTLSRRSTASCRFFSRPLSCSHVTGSVSRTFKEHLVAPARRLWQLPHLQVAASIYSFGQCSFSWFPCIRLLDA